MDLKECKEIYDAAVAANACKGNIEAAKRYLDANDVEGFERVCRGNSDWLASNNIRYVPSDGIAESWYNNGVLCTRYTYIAGIIEGLHETWYKSSILSRRVSFKDDRLDGLYTVWHENGVMFTRCNYVNGDRCGLYEEWDRYGSLSLTCTFLNGVIQK